MKRQNFDLLVWTINTSVAGILFLGKQDQMPIRCDRKLSEWVRGTALLNWSVAGTAALPFVTSDSILTVLRVLLIFWGYDRKVLPFNTSVYVKTYNILSKGNNCC